MVCGGISNNRKDTNVENKIVTVISIVFNGEKEIEETIKSVINQTWYNKIEYLIIDGNSSDNTIEIVKKYDDKISYWQSEPDKGIYDAMNKGIKLATGKWINFMNCGDVFASDDVIEKVFSNDSYDNIDVIYGDSIEVENGHEKLRISEDDSNILLKYPIYRHGASFVRTSVHKELMFDLNRKDLGFALDYYQIHTMKCMNKCFLRTNNVVMKYEKVGASSDLLKSTRLIYLITRKKKFLYATIKYLGINIKSKLGLYK